MEMGNNIEKIINELLIRTAQEFKLEFEEALETVALSELVNELSERGNIGDKNIDEIYSQLRNEITEGRG